MKNIKIGKPDNLRIRLFYTYNFCDFSISL